MARYEAKQNFSNPLMDRRFRQGEVYDLDADAEATLARAIERGRLVRIPDDDGLPPDLRALAGMTPVDGPTADDAPEGDA